METNHLVETIETPVTSLGSPSNGQRERWPILTLKPSHHLLANLILDGTPTLIPADAQLRGSGESIRFPRCHHFASFPRPEVHHHRLESPAITT
jgi:hypothetical protein